MMRKLIALLPPSVIRFFGDLQFKIPFLQPLFKHVADRLAAGNDTIRYGVGAGLRFNATGGNVGFLLGTTEPEEQEALAGFLKPGDVFYDIGANIGFYATIAARLVSESGHVYAFEPFPSSARAVETNAKLNGFCNVTVIEAAVTNKTGTVNLSIANASGQHSIAKPNDGNSIDVPSIKIDSYRCANGMQPPSVVMIDVEGAELDVLDGMIETIRQYKPVIMCEVHWILDEFYQFCERELAPLGYRLRTLRGEPLPTEPKRYHAIMATD